MTHSGISLRLEARFDPKTKGKCDRARDRRSYSKVPKKLSLARDRIKSLVSAFARGYGCARVSTFWHFHWNRKTTSGLAAMPPFPGMGYPLIPGYEAAGEVVDATPKNCRIFRLVIMFLYRARIAMADVREAKGLWRRVSSSYLVTARRARPCALIVPLRP